MEIMNLWVLGLKEQDVMLQHRKDCGIEVELKEGFLVLKHKT